MRTWIQKKLEENPRCKGDPDSAFALALDLEGIAYDKNSSLDNYQSTLTGLAMKISRDTKNGVEFTQP